MDEIIDDLSLLLSRMTQEERIECIEHVVAGNHAPVAQYKIARELEGSRSGRSTVSRDARNQEEDQKFIQALCEMSSEYGLVGNLMRAMHERSTKGLLHDEHPWSGPLSFLPCANVDLRSDQKCANPGRHACAGCRLVSYCSTVCPYLSAVLGTNTDNLSDVSESPLA
jgi:hypothetical protein